MSLSVLQVATGFPSWGGTELHILNLSDQLQRRGYNVTVACRPGCWVEERAQQMALPTVAIRVMRQQDWQDFGRLRAVLREKKVDVLHVHWSLDMIVPGFAAMREKVPVRVMSRHMPYPFKNRLGSYMYSKLFTRMVTVSNSVRNTLVGCGIPPSQVEVIHHGTDVQSFAHTTLSVKDARRSLGVADDCVAVGIVGRIAPEKGHHVLLQAAQLLRDRYPVQYVVIGSGPDEAKMRENVQQMGLDDRVLFVGFRDDVNNAMSALDIVTVPSTWNEPCSAVVQQAMALSKPVVGTRVGGTPEMVRDGETGLLVAPSDANALAGAIAQLAGDAYLRRQMGAAGREVVEAEFSLRAMTDKIENLYHREYERALGVRARRNALAS